MALAQRREPMSTWIGLELSDERLGRGDVPERFGDKGMRHLEMRFGRPSVALPSACLDLFLQAQHEPMVPGIVIRR